MALKTFIERYLFVLAFIIIALLVGLIYASTANIDLGFGIDEKGICSHRGGDAYSGTYIGAQHRFVGEVSERTYLKFTDHKPFTDPTSYCLEGEICGEGQIHVVAICHENYFDDTCARLGQSRSERMYPTCADCSLRDFKEVVAAHEDELGHQNFNYTFLRGEWDKYRAASRIDLHMITWNGSTVSCYYSRIRNVSRDVAVQNCSVRLSETRRYCKRLVYA